jgi:competence protein ComEA
MNGSGKGQMAAYAVAAVLLVVGGAYLLRADSGAKPAGGGGVALDGAGGGSTGSKPGTAARPVAGGSVYVHVAGAVRRPGIYRVRAGSRVAVAVRKAGGLTRRADLTAFNLAAAVRDAQQVIVPRRGQAGAQNATATAGAPGGTAAAAADGTGAGAGAPGRPISLATATPEQLDTLDGIGPKLSAAIIAYRNQHKGFKSVGELREVDGIGEKRFAALRKAVRP